jgi:bis(5'-adenosyl)-triphosphatase
MGAGQSVPHVHVHILPRYCGDLERNDDIYDQLESWAPRDEMSKNKPKIDVPDDSERRDRTIEEMAEEAILYRSLFDSKQSDVS